MNADTQSRSSRLGRVSGTRAIGFIGLRTPLGNFLTICRMEFSFGGAGISGGYLGCYFNIGNRQGITVSVHRFIFEPGGSKTLVTSREEFTGALVGLMLKIVKEKDLFSLHDNWLAAVRKRAEKS